MTQTDQLESDSISSFQHSLLLPIQENKAIPERKDEMNNLYP
jgi:hypothetical protein